MINVDKSCDCSGVLEAVEGCQGEQGGLRLPGREGGEGVVIRSSPSKNSSKLQENGKRLLNLLIFDQRYSIGKTSINYGMLK